MIAEIGVVGFDWIFLRLKSTAQTSDLPPLLSHNSHPSPLVCAIDLANSFSALVTHFFSMWGAAGMWLPHLACAKWLPHLSEWTTVLMLCNSLVCECPRVNDEPGVGACGKCISGEEGEVALVRLMGCCSLCIVVTRQVWDVASRIVWFNLLSRDTRKTREKETLF